MRKKMTKQKEENEDKNKLLWDKNKEVEIFLGSLTEEDRYIFANWYLIIEVRRKWVKKETHSCHILVRILTEKGKKQIFQISTPKSYLG